MYSLEHLSPSYLIYFIDDYQCDSFIVLGLFIRRNAANIFFFCFLQFLAILTKILTSIALLASGYLTARIVGTFSGIGCDSFRLFRSFLSRYSFLPRNSNCHAQFLNRSRSSTLSFIHASAVTEIFDLLPMRDTIAFFVRHR